MNILHQSRVVNKEMSNQLSYFIDILKAYRGTRLRSSHSPPLRYTLAIILVTFAFAVNQIIEIVAKTSIPPYLFLLSAIIVSSWYGGIGPGLFATTASIGAIQYFFLLPQHSGVFHYEDYIQLGVFLGEGCFISLINDVLRFSRIRSNQLIEELQTQRRTLLSSAMKIQMANKRTSKILNSISDAFVSADNEWNMTFVNAQAQTLFRKHYKIAIGRPLWLLFPPSIRGILKKLAKQSVREDKPVDQEVYLDHINQWYHLHIFPAHDGISIYIHNISNRKELESQKDTFISIASHELKTPVTTIKAYNQLLLRQSDKHQSTNSMHILMKMHNQIERLITLINDLLDVSRIQSGKMVLQKNAFFIDELVRQIADEFSQSVPTHRIHVLKTQHIVVNADVEKIQQVIVNFITNAIKYSPEGSDINIWVDSTNEKVVVGVQDSGRGISKEQQQKIFDRFYQVTESGVKRQGLGLGLYISNQIISYHKGRIWVISEPGRGSEFYFSLPNAKHLSDQTRTMNTMTNYSKGELVMYRHQVSL